MFNDSQIKVLNLYAGLGGNRKLWCDVQVTAVESVQKIADIYCQQYPNDNLIVGDAHDYLLNHFQEFDFIWSSPPCQSHSRMGRSGKNKSPRYPDFRLYEEIILLKHFFKGFWVVENVVPYYKPLISGDKKGRHLFWSNFDFKIPYIKMPKNFIMKTNTAGSEELKKWLGISYKGNIYCGNSHCPAQILRNCVHPKIGHSILEGARLVGGQHVSHT